MNIKSFSAATLSGAISMWLLAGLWHKLIMVRFYTRETEATHEGTGIILIAYLCLSLLMVYFYSKTCKGGKHAVEGLKLGAIIGILWVFPHELAMAGAHGESISYVFKNAAWHIVEQGFGGLIIGLVYGRGNP